LTDYVNAVQQNQESIGAYFDRMDQLYCQVQLTKGSTIGKTAQRSFTLEGLCRGAYHEVLAPWVKKILIGQGRLKLETASMSDLQAGATKLLATSSYYQGNILLAGKPPRSTASPAARAATNTNSKSEDTPSTDAKIETIVRHIRVGFPLNQDQTAFIPHKYKCIHCLSNTHTFEDCKAISKRWGVTVLPPDQARGRQAGRSAKPAKPAVVPPPPAVTPAAHTHLDPKAKVAMHSSQQLPGEDSALEAEESDDAFTFYGYKSDPDLLSAISQQAARKTADSNRINLIGTHQKNHTKHEVEWIDVVAGTGQQSKLANAPNMYSNRARVSNTSSKTDSTIFPRTVCPDSGATSIMGPYQDMFSDYVDVRDQGLVVRLGDKNQTIPIAGRGTLKINIQGHHVAYAHALHVPDLSVILLSSRAHRRISQGCSFIADHTRCFLTFPTFSIPIDDTEDCTIPCAKVPLNTAFDFDSRLFLLAHSTRQEVRLCTTLKLQKLHQARLVVLRKSHAHLGSSELIPAPELVAATQTMPNIPKVATTSSPTQPVYSVPDSGCKAIKPISSFDLKRMFGCRSLKDWRMLELTGTGLKVCHDNELPLTIGNMATINRNRSGKLLSRPAQALTTVGMDIGYGKGTSPGGHKYALTLIDLTTCHVWVYGLRTKGADSVINALWSFFIDAGGRL
jgi:hypothetical protein